MKHPSDELYERMGVEAMKALAPMVDLQNMTPEAWKQFVGDIFDLTDALCTELVVRLERNERLRIKEEAT